MKYGNSSVIAVISTLLMLTVSHTLSATSDASLKNSLQLDAIGIATSSGSVRHIKEKRLKLKNDVQTVTSIENLANKYSKKKVKSK